ncbi:type-F conjugative transfer system pilin assembly protein TrbC [Entomohabitans teleogrylli]|uniref:type-F conjugative transfer system pilin assembly protein TrbC n=1 Tax=Entomohabitans teleogrylli TaxID=1384589 RepID=UPI000B060892|nr:type-F conjugative transfer system pilin assembly protein TrbC [Entomohabitans teleogrylli]
MKTLLSVVLLSTTLLTVSGAAGDNASTRDFLNEMRDRRAALRQNLVNPGVHVPSALPDSGDAWITSLQEQHRSRLSGPEKPAPQVLYFLSFSIPEDGLKLMLPEAGSLGIPALINGLIDNDFRKTASAVYRLTQETNRGGVQIDPTQFTRFGISAVPALVVMCGDQHDVMYGNIRIKAALERIAAQGDCAETARQLLKGAGS